MLRSILLILSIVSLTSGQCGVGEVYTSCGTSCPDTCDNFLMTDRVCTLECVSGCFCEDGKVRAPDGTCVVSSECAGFPCGANQLYECGTECPDTCDNYDQQRVCIESCRYGCFCKQGYVLLSNSSTECVHTSQCPGRVGCDTNEHYNRCGTACPTTCDTNEDTTCSLQCVSGCACNDGYAIQESECVADSTCIGFLGNGSSINRSGFGIFVFLATLLFLF